MRMPELNGYETTQLLKANVALKHIPVIAVTASSFREEEARARKVCEGFIRKPFNRAELIAELQRFLKPAQPREQSPADTLPSASPIEAEAPVPAEALAQRSGLLAKLRQEQQTVWPELCQSLAMDEIEQFVRRLRGWAADGHWPVLRDYAASLDEQVQEFDLARPDALDFREASRRFNRQSQIFDFLADFLQIPVGRLFGVWRDHAAGDGAGQPFTARPHGCLLAIRNLEFGIWNSVWIFNTHSKFQIRNS